MLSDKVLKQIRRVDEVDSPRTTIEFLLVVSREKPGDVVDYIKKDEKHQRMKEIIDKTPNINWVNGVKRMSLNTYYYNTEMVSDYFIDELINADEKNFPIIEGILFGYYPCCILANDKGSTINEPMPATEHYWCSKDCKKSIAIQKQYIQTVKKYLPKYASIIKEESLINLDT